jgi:hypothetical protein
VLFDPTVRWVAAAEASPFAGDLSRPLALDFASDGSSVGGGLVVRDGKLTLANVCIGCGGGSDGPRVLGHTAQHQMNLAASTAEAPAPRAAFAAVYSKVDGRAFVVGGRTSNGDLVSDIWTFWLDKQMWTRVPLRPGSLGDVVSATYSFRDRRVWILDVAPGDRRREALRLLRVDPITGEDEVVLTSRCNRTHERYDYRGLTLDMDGNVVLFASSQKAQRHRIGVIEVGELGNRKGKKAKDAWLTKRRERALATPPFIDLRGVGLYFEPPRAHRGSPAWGKHTEDENRPSNGTAAGERLRELPVQRAHLHQLEDLLQ